MSFVSYLILQLGVGLSDASAVRVGQALGAGLPTEAMTATRVGLTLIGMFLSCWNVI